MSNNLHLVFSSASRPSLESISYTDPSGRERVSLRGRGAGDGHTGTFPWTRAVRALSVLAVRSYLSVHDGEMVPVISGYRGALAASLDAAVSKEPRWLVELFGTECCGRARARRVMLRTNPDLRRPGPVSLGLNPHLLDPKAIGLSWDQGPISHSEARSLLALLEAQDKVGSIVPQEGMRGPRDGRPRPVALTGVAHPNAPKRQVGRDQLSGLERMMLFDPDGLLAAEPLAQATQGARLVAANSVIVPFCGCGLTAIALALAGKSVTAIDPSAERIGMAVFNAALAGVSDRIRFVQGDPLEACHEGGDATIVMWLRGGGAEARTVTVSELDAVHPEGSNLLAAAAARGQAVEVVTPANLDARDFAREQRVLVTSIGSSCVGGRLKRTA